jgi:hypothetical protein
MRRTHLVLPLALVTLMACRAHMHGAGNIVFDAAGNLTIHEDHFTLKPIGK